MIKSIQTAYDGRLFRSRIEARHAVLFKTLGIQYDYEPIGFQLKDQRYYLPDFFLPNVYRRGTKEKGWFIEIKHTDGDASKAEALGAEQLYPVLFVEGMTVRADRHIEFTQYGQDSEMNFRKCENTECGAILIGYGHRDAICPECGGYCSDKEVLAAVEIANMKRFEFTDAEPWPIQPVADADWVF